MSQVSILLPREPSTWLPWVYSSPSQIIVTLIAKVVCSNIDLSMSLPCLKFYGGSPVPSRLSSNSCMRSLPQMDLCFSPVFPLAFPLLALTVMGWDICTGCFLYWTTPLLWLLTASSDCLLTPSKLNLLWEACTTCLKLWLSTGFITQV